MNYKVTINRIYDHIENDQVENALLGCLRIARHLKDHLNTAVFLRELYPHKDESSRILYNDMSNLKKEAFKYVWESSIDRWIELHTVEYLTAVGNEYHEDTNERRNILAIAAGELDGELEQWERIIADMTLPLGMSQFDVVAFTDRFTQEKAQIRLRIKAIHLIKSRLKTRCYNYAIQIERQIAIQQRSQGFLEAVQNDVNNYFKVRSDEVYAKLQKAAELAESKELEDAALLLTEVRRALKSVADYFYAPVAKQVKCADGKDRLMGDDQYLNRLHEFLSATIKRSTSYELLRAEFDSMASFIRRLNDIASKGVHGAVTVAEAKQGLIGLYFFLFNLIQHMQRADEATAVQ